MAFAIGTICVIVGAGCEVVAFWMLLGAWQKDGDFGIGKFAAKIGLGLIIAGLAGLVLG